MHDISVIVPCYNTEKYIDGLLGCLKRQDVGEYSVEYIFVMNLCTDGTEERVRKSGLSATILQCDVRGCGCARNVGIEASDGRYIWFMDSDDLLLCDTAIKDAMELADGKPIIRIPFESNLFKTQHFSMVWQYVISRDLIGDTRFRKTQPCEDDVFTAKILDKVGHSWRTYTELPTLEYPAYYYLYGREGSNMSRFSKGEDINV